METKSGSSVEEFGHLHYLSKHYDTVDRDAPAPPPEKCTYCT